MATQYFKRNLFLNLYRERKKIYISLVCFLLLLKRGIKNVCHFQPIFSVWRPLAFLSATLSTPLHALHGHSLKPPLPLSIKVPHHCLVDALVVRVISICCKASLELLNSLSFC